MIPVRRKTNRTETITLSEEQQYFIQKGIEGRNILVDACIGSGKTTSIQHLCNELEDKRILYLTYNKLLKLDAKRKIKSRNTMVTNYHGFACWAMTKNGIKFSYSDSIQQFLEAKLPLPKYDLLIIDEYQDIETELAEMLIYIKESNPEMQIIAVGDMEQKIYDKTSLDVPTFIDAFLDDYLEMEFTTCFRLSSEIAEMLGRVWNKTIKGVNDECEVSIMGVDDVEDFLKDKDPKDVLCLGSRLGGMTTLLNRLEDEYPDKYNKKTVYASISVSDSASTEPTNNSAIFTTFDSCKGMEKPYCIVFDWTYDYWITRLRKPNQSYEILRNIFCVAASRGKKNIIFVGNEDMLLTEDELSTCEGKNSLTNAVLINDMFNFKYREDIDEAYEQLNISDISSNNRSLLNLKEQDELIDLMPCISVYQKASYFTDYDIDDEIEKYLLAHKEFKKPYKNKRMPLDKKVLFLVFMMTRHNRYLKQVATPFISKKEKELLHARLKEHLNKNTPVQIDAEIKFHNKHGDYLFSAIGLADAIKDDTVYMINYKHSISEVDCLACACFVYALGLEKGIVWDTKDNTMLEISIKDKNKFMDNVIKAVTKGEYTKFY